MFQKEFNQLVTIDVLKRQDESEWGLPAFIIFKKDQTIRLLTDFREVNKQIVCKPFPIPKISSILQRVEGFIFATAIDLNMGYYTIRLDPLAQHICTIVLPWGSNHICAYQWELYVHQTSFEH